MLIVDSLFHGSLPNFSLSASVFQISLQSTDEMCSDRRLIEALDDFVSETGDDRCWATFTGYRGAEIKEFVLVDLAAGSAMGATNVVSQNFEPGHRVGFGVVAKRRLRVFGRHQ